MSFHAQSWFAATAHAAPPRPALTGRVDADVCVVGGGVAGCSTALHLAERGLRVVLLEERLVGSAASGRNGGQLLAGYGCGQGTLTRLLGAADARHLWDWSVEGLDLARRLIERHAIDCDWRPGHLQLALKPRHEDEIRAELEQHARYGYDATRFVPREEVRSLVDSPRYVAGLHDARAGHVHPLNYTLGLAAAAERAGARIHEGTRAIAVDAGEPATVRTGSGEVRAKYVALCGNAHLGATAPRIRSRIMPVGTYVVATEPLGADAAARLIARDLAVSDMNWVLDYYRLSRDGRLLFGGEVSYSGYDPRGVAPRMQRRIERVFPQLRGVRLDHVWGGLIDITANRAPDFGRLAPNVYYVQGFSGHGMVLAGLAGRLIAETIAGHAERFDVYARIAHLPFPGGRLLARPLLVAAMTWYRLRDAL
jgi:gamma-glutamylputrescine oxidase